MSVTRQTIEGFPLKCHKLINNAATDCQRKYKHKTFLSPTHSHSDSDDINWSIITEYLSPILSLISHLAMASAWPTLRHKYLHTRLESKRACWQLKMKHLWFTSLWVILMTRLHGHNSFRLFLIHSISFWGFHSQFHTNNKEKMACRNKNNNEREGCWRRG